MSGSFTGFSEDDIRKLTDTNPAKVKVNAVGNNKSNKPVLKPQKRASNNHQSSDELRNKILNEKIQTSRIEPIIEGAKLNKPAEPLQPVVAENKPAEPLQPVVAENKPAQTSEKKILSSIENFHLDTTPKNSKLDKIPEDEPSTESVNQPSKNETKKEASLVERKLDLDEFQAKQKLIEEQNRKRKELLIKALAVKTKQTQEETQRLNEIRDEFKKLDALLSNDVKILRQEIEVASLDYMEAEKKYNRVEKEFLESKLVLHQKLERKEMLTEHLCTIIEKNEERKGEKLNELLSKLNLKPDLQTVDKNNLQQGSDGEKQATNNLEATNDNVEVDNTTKSGVTE